MSGRIPRRRSPSPKSKDPCKVSISQLKERYEKSYLKDLEQIMEFAKEEIARIKKGNLQEPLYRTQKIADAIDSARVTTGRLYTIINIESGRVEL